jgi:putative tricarboxylic transport membrane protein
MMDKRRDLAVALVVAGLGAAIVILAFDVPIGRVRDPIGTRTMPIVVGALICAGGVALAVRRLLRWRQDPVEIPAEGAEDDQPDRPASAWRALSMWVLCFGYVALLSRGGFLILTPLLIAAGLWLMGVRQPVRLVAVSLVPVALMYWLLGIVLNVRLPLGPFEPYLG